MIAGRASTLPAPPFPTLLLAGAAVLAAASICANAVRAQSHDTSAAYVDREIDPARLGAPDTVTGTAPDPAGWPRTLLVESRGHVTTQGDLRRIETSVVVAGRIETPRLGAFGIDAALRAQPTRDHLFTLSQRGLPLEGGWLVNSSLGMLGSPVIDLMRNQTRFFLPAFGLDGAATEWLRDDLQWNASTGRPGNFESLIAPGFRSLGGQLQSVGLQWTPSPGWQGGVQLADARDVRAVTDPFGTGSAPGQSGRSALGALAWRNGTVRLQGNALTSRRDGSAARGFWLDGLWQDSSSWHSFGGYRLEPGLAWGNRAISNDIAGLYYRTSQSRPRWAWDAGAETLRPVAGPGNASTQVSGTSRYRLDTRLDVGGGLTLRQRAGDTSWSWFGYGERRNDAGNTRLQIDALSEAGRRNQQVRLDHGWTTAAGARLAASLGVGEDSSAAGDARYLSAALYGGVDLSERLRVDGNARLRTDHGEVAGSAPAFQGPTGTVATNSQRTTLNLSLGLVRQFNRQWSLSSTWYETRGWDDRSVGLSPLIPNPVPLVPPATRSLFVALRYEDRAGSPAVPLGGKAGDGAGAISGVLFLDANDNGLHDAQEGFAANVTVLLDNKFATRTDALGRFEFPLVVTGRHSITVVPDNLPLPWTLGPGVRQEVTVKVRATTPLAIPAIRIR